MRLLCIADATEPLIYSRFARDRYREVDLVLSAGDLPLHYYDYIQTVLRKDVCFVYGNHNLEDFGHYIGREDLRDARFANSWPASGDRRKSVQCGGIFLDGRCLYLEDRGLIIAGLGGSMLYNGGKSQYSERQMRWRIRRLVPRLLYNKRKYGRALDILLTHAPPFQIGDGPDLCHRGFECFRGFIAAFQPRYIVHGHVHLDDINAPRVREYRGTKIINAYRSYLLEDDSL